MTTLRLGLRLGLLGVIASALTTCAAKPDATECSTGIICPEPLHCAAVQPVCITGLCGNGHIDPGEQCDDGNIIAGDGCSPTCQLEECGNGILDPGEVCDLGAGNNGKCKGCSADCKSNESCGNGIIDPECGEVCDDGPTADTEGVCAVGSDGEHCGDHCKSDETCGNDIVDVGCGEVCDPPGVNGCQPGCTSAGSCGNGIVDPGEECDDGLDTMAPAFNCDNCDCRSDCVINRCGDGFVDSMGSQHHEDCDAAPEAGSGDRQATPTQSPSCNLDCTTSVCGDSKVNGSAGEQCDNGSANNNDADCTAGCQVNVCGDGFDDTVGPVHIEPCDLGSANGGSSGCSVGCSIPTCGNGILDQGEQCDLGPANSDTGACLPTCLLARCGDGFVETGVEQCDPGSAGGASCSPTTSSAPCRFQICGNGILDPGEQCDLGSGSNGNGLAGTCSTLCKVQFCGDGVKNDGEACDTAGNSATCNLNCTVPRCGDGIVNPDFIPTGAGSGEQCDPPDPGNGCSALCQFEHCGNGVVDPGEQCDPPGSISGGFTCSPSCLLEKCGNGILDPGEQCDLGSNVGSNSPCPSCQLARCGDGLVETGVEQCDLGSANGLGSGPGACDSLCQNVVCGNQILEPGEQCDDGNENDGSGKRCNAGCKFNVCGDGDLLIGVEQCDSNGVDSATCNGSSCTLSVCGDGHINTAAGEACDNGSANGVLDGSCDASCHIPGCGNGIVEAGEECDPGTGTGSAAVNTATCNFNCTTPRCGDGIINKAAGEVCDQGVLNGDPCPYGDPTCQVCNDTCTGSASPGGPYCGDGIVQGSAESCDLGLGSNGATACPYGTPSCNGCGSNCEDTSLTGNVCGDGIEDVNNEICDDGNTDACGTCSGNCKLVLEAPAEGTIVAVVGSQISDGDQFTLNDGVNAAQTFTFRLSPGSDTDIGFTAADPAATVAGEIEAAINQHHTIPLLMTASPPSGVFITLTHQRDTHLGDVAQDQALQDGIVVIGMEGGQGGDCGAGIACRSNDDCQSHSCDVGGTDLCLACDTTACIAAGGACSADGSTCVISATADAAACPRNASCDITCAGTTCEGSTIDCSQSASCTITCSGDTACSNETVKPGSGVTTMVCSGGDSCNTVTEDCTSGDCINDTSGLGCGSNAGPIDCTGNCGTGSNCL